MNEILIMSGGVFNIALIIFHSLFWRIFDWQNDLKTLSFINRNIMQVLNISLTFAFVIFAYISLFHTDELLSTETGLSLLVLMSLFWFFRAIQQIIFFKLNTMLSWVFFMVFMLGSVLYAIPALNII